jgi:hypothetical protein
MKESNRGGKSIMQKLKKKERYTMSGNLSGQVRPK